MFVWLILAFGAWVYVDLGRTAPHLSFSDIPGGSMGAFVGAMAATIAGWIVIGILQQRHESAEWQEVGRQAGLQPAGDGSRSPPDLTGTVDGRTVTVRVDRRTTSWSDDGKVTFTIGQAELDGPADDGLVVGTVGGRVDAGVGTLDFDDVVETVSAVEGLVAVETDGLVLMGTSSSAVEAVAGDLSGEALRSVRDLRIVSVGDGAGVVAKWAEARNEELEGSIAEYPVDNLVERIPGDAATVTVETASPIRDGEALRRYVEGAVAIADAFESATDRDPPAG